MSLADKLNYLKQTKNLIKQAINNKGGTLTADSSFRSYADEIDNIGSTMTATAEDILIGKTAISNSGIITGTYENEYNVALKKGVYQTSVSTVGIPSSLSKVVDLDGLYFTGTDYRYMFNGCVNLEEIKNMFNTSTATDMSYMFQSCEKLIQIPQLNTSNVTNMTCAFYDCIRLEEIPTLDLSKCTNLYQAFQYDKALKNITFTNASKVTNLYQTFSECSLLETVSDFGEGLVNNLNQTFNRCQNLITAPYINTSTATAFYQTFYNCRKLENLPQYDTSRVTQMNGTFTNCLSLTNDSLNNILAMCANSATTNTTYKKLKYIGLTSAQATICQGLSNYQAFLDAGWTTGY